MFPAPTTEEGYSFGAGMIEQHLFAPKHETQQIPLEESYEQQREKASGPSCRSHLSRCGISSIFSPTDDNDEPFTAARKRQATVGSSSFISSFPAPMQPSSTLETAHSSAFSIVGTSSEAPISSIATGVLPPDKKVDDDIIEMDITNDTALADTYVPTSAVSLVSDISDEEEFITQLSFLLKSLDDTLFLFKRQELDKTKTKKLISIFHSMTKHFSGMVQSDTDRSLELFSKLRKEMRKEKEDEHTDTRKSIFSQTQRDMMLCFVNKGELPVLPETVEMVAREAKLDDPKQFRRFLNNQRARRRGGQ
ncbi:hypothetical protein ADUPG1_009513 [Aduncisulcus paluster]|uniref:Uncharacterized protein n=1 Tax=Aduncisulcus paluster TaxID=2918883 RepID=A0ABQ5KVU5_9EUKA|nr:hypothetical protein ADUPG1_009513 [Aduncisulcus paluster]|eukprot:gnl/Carplike_NY0171/5211_a7112_207.p1 GENE.gnl/Carplike_NY0171/5211_a7112_207~~gnl/Carplike_NY0171/5211_a7112_207.p1  ORF type:complete len:342 (-),score=58.44 gnl/Carplike_NY0171/5211_a7112_207:259-1179(-)